MRQLRSREIRGDGAKLLVETASTTEAYDGVVVTLGTSIAAALCPGLDPAERAALAGVPYQGVVCTSVLLDRPLAGYYLTYLMDDAPFTTIVEMTSLVDPELLGGRTLVYLPQYLAADDPTFDVADAVIEERVVAGLRHIHPTITDNDIVAVRTTRARCVFPLPVLGYSPTVHGVATSVAGPAPGLERPDRQRHAQRQRRRLPRQPGGGRPAGTGRLVTSADPNAEAAVSATGRATASVSLDMDNLWSYQKTHGDPGWEKLPSYLDEVVPIARCSWRARPDGHLLRRGSGRGDRCQRRCTGGGRGRRP